jgi:hypothetical protein
MKIILRDSLTGLYYGRNQIWSAEISEAMNFDSIQMAASVALDDAIETVNVVLRYEEPTCELALPLERCVFEATGTGIKGRYPRHVD